MAGRRGQQGSGRSPYSAAMTREQFLFYEMRTTARLLHEGDSPDEVEARIVAENLFQYPTERMLGRMARACLRRIVALDDPGLVEALANAPFDEAKQIALYAMMKSYVLVAEFMVTVVGEKYRTRDFALGKADITAFFLRLREQDDVVAAWSDATITKLRQVLVKTLAENAYLDNVRAERLNPVWLSPALERTIRAHGDEILLPAFNCFS
ncbi:DUF1819 family protein [Selenomonas noxia]|uniref:DUF1819 family protein n=1 Tax=Selenomonas noxia TaxID=135083 RepID=UPI0023599DCE|nr:DUF1819 family protein [Selenomonas noxia]